MTTTNFVDQTTLVPAAWLNDVDALTYDVFAAATTAALARSALGLVIGTNVQAYSALLSAIAALTPTDGNIIVGNGATWVAESGATARTSLGLGTAAIVNTGVTAGNVPTVDQTLNATARAATTTLGTSLNHTLSDTSTTITAFNGVAGVTYHCRCLGAGAITYHATNLIITQTGASIAATAAGDTFDVEMITGTTCRLKNYTKADGTAMVSATAVHNYILIQEQQTSGTNGGTFTSGSWQTRTLNIEVTDSGNDASLASNQITLAAGTYEAIITSHAYRVDGHACRLQNVTDSATLVNGEGAISFAASDYGAEHSLGFGRFTIASSKVLELQAKCNTTRATDGLGRATYQATEIFASVQLTRVV